MWTVQRALCPHLSVAQVEEDAPGPGRPGLAPHPPGLPVHDGAALPRPAAVAVGVDVPGPQAPQHRTQW